MSFFDHFWMIFQWKIIVCCLVYSPRVGSHNVSTYEHTHQLDRKKGRNLYKPSLSGGQFPIWGMVHPQVFSFSSHQPTSVYRRLLARRSKATFYRILRQPNSPFLTLFHINWGSFCHQERKKNRPKDEHMYKIYGSLHCAYKKQPTIYRAQ